MVNPSFWRGKRVFVTGHTGFKGAWLALWLESMGAEVSGYALEAVDEKAAYNLFGIENSIKSCIGDIRDYEKLHKELEIGQPDIVFHMAARSLVRESYEDPIGVYDVNALGTAKVLEAVRKVGSAKAVVVITSDKCYENREWDWGYRENEAMGGFDPYSSSKGCAELVVAGFRQSFYKDASIGLASARAGNVIGGGDWARDRLVPDLISAFSENRLAKIRHPGAIRPWQHVLDCLSGYLELSEKLFDDFELSGPWNFGPSSEGAKPVEWVADNIGRLWSGGQWVALETKGVHEAKLLKLDCSKAHVQLGWFPKLSVLNALELTVNWYRSYFDNKCMRGISLEQLKYYTGLGGQGRG